MPAQPCWSAVISRRLWVEDSISVGMRGVYWPLPRSKQYE